VNGLQGVQAAAITPRGKHGEVDLGAAFELIDHLCKGGAGGILLFGAPGEYPAFSAEERARLVYLAVKRSRVPVIAGVGAVTLDASIELAREARDAGAAAPKPGPIRRS
jgi:4-hydroxy-tetrahydrodipicolinate synthase